MLKIKEAVKIYTASFFNFRDYRMRHRVAGQGASLSTNISISVVVEKLD